MAAEDSMATADGLERRAQVMIHLYAKLQAIRMNELYFERRAKAVRRQLQIVQITTAAVASSAFVSSIASWFPSAVPVLIGLAALIGIAAPYLGLEQKASGLYAAAVINNSLRSRMELLLGDMRRSRLTGALEGRGDELRAIEAACAPADGAGDQRLLEECWAQATREYPPTEEAWATL